MAGIKRSRGDQSFLNKPIGVVNVTTGRERVYETRAQVATGVRDASLGVAKTLQLKEGQKFGEKVRVRDESGNINYVKPPMSLGRYGRENAEKILSKRYNVALKQDALKTAADFRTKYRDEESFNAAYQEYIKTTATELGKTGDEQFANLFVNNAETVRLEHSLDIKNKAFQVEILQTKRQAEDDYRATIGMVATAMVNGDVGEAEFLAKQLSETLEEDGIAVHGLSSEKVGDLQNALSDTLRNSKIQAAAKNYTLQDLVKLENAVKFRDFSDEKLKADMPWLEDLINQSSSTPQRANTLNVFVSGLKTARSSQSAVSKQINLAIELLKHRDSGKVFENNAAARNALDAALAANGVDTTNIFQPVARSIIEKQIDKAPFASNFLNRSFSNIAGSGIYEPQEIQQALSLYKRIINPVDYGLSEQNIEFMERLDSTLTNFGGKDPIMALDLARRVRNNEPADLAAVEAFIAPSFQSKDRPESKDIDVLARAWMDKKMPGIRPNHRDEMATLAASLMITDKGSVETVLERVYDYRFIDSDYLLPNSYEKSEGLKAKSRFAPEAFMNKDQLPKFDEIVNKQLGRFNVPNLAFGENVFLEVVMGQSNTAQYRFVNEFGTPLQTASGEQPIFGALAIKQFLSENAERQAREAELRRLLVVREGGVFRDAMSPNVALEGLVGIFDRLMD